MKPYALLLLVCCMAAPAMAQDLSSLSVHERHPQEEQRPWHISDVLSRRPEARAALEEFHRAKAAGLLPVAHKSSETLEIGTTRNFNVLINLRSSPSWTTRSFTLKAESDLFFIWVDDAEISNGHVRDEDVEALRDALRDHTPTDSVNPNAGIIANDNAVFGSPPNVDGDGKVDILITDIQDNRQPGESAIAGFVTSEDLSLNPPAGRGNSADVLYLDTQPGLVSDSGARRDPADSLLPTAAHEYQHLIHFNYQFTEITFVNEGLSYWAEGMNGFRPWPTDYLKASGSQNANLYRWDIDKGIDDIERSALLTNYVSEQIGTMEVGRITRSNRTGTEGYNVALGAFGLNLRGVLVDFHTANFLNDVALDPRWGYTASGYQSFRAEASRVFDGGSGTETPASTETIQAGAVQYYSWENVADLNVSVEVLSGLSSNVRVRGLLERPGSTVEVTDVEVGGEGLFLPGTFDRVTVVVTHVAPDVGAVQIRYAANWSATGIQLQAVQYDNGETQAPYLVLGNGVRQAVRFSIPEDGRLTRVSLANYYDNQFGNSTLPETAPRDFQVHVWADNGAGQPGDEVLGFEMDDPRSYAPVTSSTLDFFEVDLTAYADVLADLSGTVYVGISDTGSDENYLTMGMSSYAVENTSFLSLPGGSWLALWDLELNDGTSLSGRTLPVRAEFLIDPTATPVEDAGTLPGRVALQPNYPNPFNPVTTVEFALPAAARVRLAVYDVLGRQVAVLVDRVQPAGAHRVRVDASEWAGGIYFYTLETGSERLTRQMILLK